VALTPAKEAFAADVARRTGLEIPTVRAWVAIENGPDDNPLNIASWANGRRYFTGFGSTQKAVDATVRLLTTSANYKPVLAVARHPQATIRDELWAIIESPWEETNYTLNGVRGARLIGTYASLYPKSGSSSSPPPTLTRQPVSDAQPVFNPADPFGVAPDWWPFGPPTGIDGGVVGGWVTDLARWAGDKAALAFLYVVLTAAAAALIVMGLLRATGTSAGALRPSRALGGQTDDIPF